LISFYVKGYNYGFATKDYDYWTIAATFAFLEGYTFIYDEYYYLPLIKLL